MQSAFRLEVLQEYGEPSEKNAVAAYLRGEDVSRAYIGDWCELVSAHQQQGRDMKRVHLVDLPLSAYMRFEIECAYTHTSRAGEKIGLLNNTEVPEAWRHAMKEDFWLFDDARVMVQIYDGNGTLQRARLTSDPTAVAYYRQVRDFVLRAARPFNEFYARENGVSL